jgi:hypothetical protein
MQAMIWRMPGLRQIVSQCSTLVRTSNFSSLSHALRRKSGVEFVLSLIRQLESGSRYQRGDLVAIDSMAVMFGRKRRHHCEKVNNHAVGGGVLWTYQVDTRSGACPVRLLRCMRGAWNDAGLMSEMKLEPNGPVYLMDRGFYCIDLAAQWLEQKVRFVVRVKAGDLQYDVVEELSPARQLKNGWALQSDQFVELGSPNRRQTRPKVRLIVALSPGGEQFIFATSEMDWSAQAVLDGYKKRWHIERFHRFLKNNIGLAHIYSFDANGLEFLILTALLTAMLLVTTTGDMPRGETIKMLFAVLAELRAQLGVAVPWKRNILAVKRGCSKHRKRAHK